MKDYFCPQTWVGGTGCCSSPIFPTNTQLLSGSGWLSEQDLGLRELIPGVQLGRRFGLFIHNAGLERP